MRESQTERVRETTRILAKAGFYVYHVPAGVPSIFDCVARRDEVLLIIRTVTNADSVANEVARELKAMALALRAVPLVVSERAGGEDMQHGILYTRSGLAVLTLRTMEEFLLEGVPPFVFSAPGGLYVKMDGELLRRVRQENDISLGDLANIAGVSRRAVQQYEDGAGATVDVAVRIEKYLRQPVIQPLDPFTRRGEDHPVGAWVEEELGRLRGQERRVADQLGALGFKVVPTQRCPFDALGTRMSDRLITGIEEAQSPLGSPREEVLETLARITEARPVIFSGRKQRKKRRVPVVSVGELDGLGDPNRLLDLIDDRQQGK